MPLPLEGIRVLDLSQMFVGPGTGMYLADQGAEVVKVEPPQGDDCRRLFTSPFLKEESRPFLVVNRGKKGIVVDIRQEAGREIVLKLAQRADVLIENFRPGVAERLGLGYDEVSRLNPRLVYASISAFGRHGPYAASMGYDQIIQGMAGVMSHRGIVAARGRPEAPPVPAGIWVADTSGPMLLAYGIMLALFLRERTGRGQKVETALLAAAMAMQSVDLVTVERDTSIAESPVQAMWSPYRCRDGAYINIVVVNDVQWQRLARVLGLGHLASDSRYGTVAKRAAASDELFPILEAAFLARPRDEWLELLQKEGVACGPVLARSEVLSQPQVLENQFAIVLDHPVVGRTRMMGVPVMLSQNPGRVRGPAPTLGQHTEEVLLWLGYAPARIAELRQAGVI